MKIDEFDAVECNEAFAAIALMWQKEFEPTRWSASTRAAARSRSATRSAQRRAADDALLRHLEATGGRYGFQTMCEGGGQANATVIERLG